MIGFTNIDDVGQEGLELAYNDWLAGKPGLKRVIRDRLGRTVEHVEVVREAEPGHDLSLTIDRRLQYLAYRELKRTVLKHGARSGSVVLLDVKSGEVLAMVNQPSYNPNHSDIDSEGLRNRAITDVFEPGSVMKPFAVASALETGPLDARQRRSTRRPAASTSAGTPSAIITITARSTSPALSPSPRMSPRPRSPWISSRSTCGARTTASDSAT